MIDDNIDFIDVFEQKLADYAHSKYCVCTDCCTNALLLSLEAKYILGKIDKHSSTVVVPAHTYMSVPMTLQNNGWKIVFSDEKWSSRYSLKIQSANGHIEDTYVVDAAVDFREGLADDVNKNALICLSFQQKKRLSLGRGGAILSSDVKAYCLLKRLVYDGRNPRINDTIEVNSRSKDIICGYHSYLEPDKAARGILLLNQPSMLMPYQKIGYAEYPDLRKLLIWK